MNRLGIPESEQPALLAYLKRTYRYEDGGIVNRKTGRRVKGCKTENGYLSFGFRFRGKNYCSKFQRIVWALCYDRLPTLTIDHINGKKLDNRIGNLREVSLSENLLNMLLPWKPNKDTSVASVSFCRNIYQTKIQGRNYYFSNPYEAFYWAMVCGKRHRS